VKQRVSPSFPRRPQICASPNLNAERARSPVDGLGPGPRFYKRRSIDRGSSLVGEQDPSGLAKHARSVVASRAKLFAADLYDRARALDLARFRFDGSIGRTLCCEREGEFGSGRCDPVLPHVSDDASSVGHLEVISQPNTQLHDEDRVRHLLT